jgi:hypothetical protein
MVLVPGYLVAASFVTALLARGGPGWLNVLVLIFVCYAPVLVMPTRWQWDS